MPKDFVKRVERALEAMRSGKFVILTDDADRENEGDLVLAAQFATPETINFMAQHGRGLICLPMAGHIVDRLDLPPMVRQNESKLGTAFTLSIGSKKGITTGISAQDRAFTIQTAIKESTTRDDIVVPGHVFPLRAQEGGVLVRAGHTEGSVDLSKLAGLKPAAVICEILQQDGTMARENELKAFADEFNIPIMSIADLILYRLQKDESLLSESSRHDLGNFDGKKIEFFTFESVLDGCEHWAWRIGYNQKSPSEVMRVRVVNEDPMKDWILPLTLESSLNPLRQSLKLLAKAESGVMVVLRKSSPKIGTDSESQLPSSSDGQNSRSFRQYGIGAQILRRLGVQKMEIITNHPKTLVGLEGFGLELVRTIGIPENTQGKSL